MILLDANVLVASLDLKAPGHPESRAVVAAALDRRLPGVLVPQVLLEAYAVLTDDRRVETPLSPVAAWTEMHGLTHLIPVMFPQRQVLEEITRIVERGAPRAQSVFDAFLVAQMRAAGIGTICTYNVADFEAYEGISAEAPEAVVARISLKRPKR